MTGLLYHPFKPDSIIHFKEGIDAYVDEAPFFKLSEILLAEIKRAGKVKLTQKGNLPMSVCKLLCDQDLIYWRYMQYVKKITEDAIPYLFPLKQYLLDDGIVKKRNNTLSLTKRGEKLLDAKKIDSFYSSVSLSSPSLSLGLFPSPRRRWQKRTTRMGIFIGISSKIRRFAASERVFA